jgi:hypothetical protein
VSVTDAPSVVGVAFPSVDVGAIRGAATALGAGGAELGGWAAAMGGVADHTALSWTGIAADAWRTTAGVASTDLGTSSSVLGEIAAILGGLADELEEARLAYYRAVNDAVEAAYMQDRLNQRMEVATPEIAEEYGARFSAAGAELAAARAAAGAAADAAMAAGLAAAERLAPLAARAAEVGLFAGIVVDPTLGPIREGEGAEPDWLVLLFGSLADNHAGGIEFQARVLEQLGLSENARIVEGEVAPGRVVRTRPDGLTTEAVYEIKNSVYVYRSSQIRAQIAHANANQQSYTLVINRYTRVSGPLRDLIGVHDYGAEVVRRQPGGTFTDYQGRPVEPVGEDGSGGWRYRDPETREEAERYREENDGETWPDGLNHPSGYEVDMRPEAELVDDGSSDSTFSGVFLPQPMPAPYPVLVPGPVPIPLLVP